ncbi:MAG: hemolysin family protein [Muribaculaceae bacterium]
MTGWLIITLVSLLCSGLFSGSEIAFITADRVRMKINIKRGGIISSIIEKFYNNTEFFISSILVGNNVMLVIYGMGAAYFLEPWLSNYTQSEALVLILQTIISTAVILLFGEFLPKTIFRINPNSSLRLFALPIFLFYIIFYPISLFTAWLSKMLMRLVGIKSGKTQLTTLSVDDLGDYIEDTIDDMEQTKQQVEHEVKLFRNAIDFSSTHLRDCMTPRNEIVAVDINDTTTSQLSALFTSTGRSKILVYKGEIDNVLGYIHVSELFKPGEDWHKKIIPIPFAPETLLANKMMRRLLQEKRSMAIVVDEFGGMAGLVTLEDLVEEIFGDIQDEHDRQRLVMRRTGDNTFEISGRCEIVDINETFNLQIPESDDYQTLAGYIFTSTGSIPDAGTCLDLDGIQYTILKKTATRLQLIRVRTPEEGDKSSAK